LNLEAARAIALEANPDIHAARARLEAAAARLAEDRSRFLPTLVFTHTSTRTFHTPANRNRLSTLLQPQPTYPTDVESNSFALTTLINALSRPYGTVDQSVGNRNSFSEHTSALTMSWTVFDGFAREARALSSKAVHQAAQASLADTRRLITQAVDAAYYQIQLAEAQILISRADEQFAEEQYGETEKLRRAGRATAADVNNFRYRTLAARANVAAAVGLRDTGRAVLAELMACPGALLPEDVTLSALENETAAEMAVPDAEPWIEAALAHRSDLAQLKHLVESAEELVRVAKALFMPSMAFSGSWGFDRSSDLDYSFEDQSSAVALEFRWELYTGGAREARVGSTESSRAEACANLKRRQLAVQAEVRSVITDLTNAQEQIRLQTENVEIARENRRIVRAGYLAGTETLNRLNEAQRDLVNAQADLALARIRLRKAWSDLRAAAGTNGWGGNGLLSEPGQADSPGAAPTSGSPKLPLLRLSEQMLFLRSASALLIPNAHTPSWSLRLCNASNDGTDNLPLFPAVLWVLRKEWVGLTSRFAVTGQTCLARLDRLGIVVGFLGTLGRTGLAVSDLVIQREGDLVASVMVVAGFINNHLDPRPPVGRLGHNLVENLIRHRSRKKHGFRKPPPMRLVRTDIVPRNNRARPQLQLHQQLRKFLIGVWTSGLHRPFAGSFRRLDPRDDTTGQHAHQGDQQNRTRKRHNVFHRSFSFRASRRLHRTAIQNSAVVASRSVGCSKSPSRHATAAKGSDKLNRLDCSRIARNMIDFGLEQTGIRGSTCAHVAGGRSTDSGRAGMTPRNGPKASDPRWK
ncbi:MAG: TolC family protein, partial [Planctomycetes bacterium]|nr:TolC family protein [Planctomycetota bacterium]